VPLAIAGTFADAIRSVTYCYAGNINSIGLSFNKDIKVYIKQQQLVKSEIDGIVKVDNVTTYNNLSETFNDFKFKALRPEHKSYYSQLDIDEMNSNT
jgi:hypothetical protein